MKSRVKKGYALALLVVLCSTSALLARKVPDNLGNKLSSAPVTFCTKLEGDMDTSDSNIHRYSVKETRTYGSLKKHTTVPSDSKKLINPRII